MNAGHAPGACIKQQVLPLGVEAEKDFPVALEHLWTSLPCSLFFKTRAVVVLLPLQQLSVLSLCPQTWLKGTCSWSTWAGTSEPTRPPSPPPRWKASPRWPCATATTTSAASPWRQVLLGGRRGGGSSGCHLPAGWKGQCWIRGDLVGSEP